MVFSYMWYVRCILVFIAMIYFTKAVAICTAGECYPYQSTRAVVGGHISWCLADHFGADALAHPCSHACGHIATIWLKRRTVHDGLLELSVDLARSPAY